MTVKALQVLSLLRKDAQLTAARPLRACCLEAAFPLVVSIFAASLVYLVSRDMDGAGMWFTFQPSVECYGTDIHVAPAASEPSVASALHTGYARRLCTTVPDRNASDVAAAVRRPAERDPAAAPALGIIVDLPLNGSSTVTVVQTPRDSDCVVANVVAPGLLGMLEPPPLSRTVMGTAQCSSGFAPALNAFQNVMTFAAQCLAVALVPLAASTSARAVDEKRIRLRQHVFAMGVDRASAVVAAQLSSCVRAFLSAAVVCAALLLCSLRVEAIDTSTVGNVFGFTWLFGWAQCSVAHLLPSFTSRAQVTNAIVVLHMLGGAAMAPWVTAPQRPFLAVLFCLVSPGTTFIVGAAPALAGNVVTLIISPTAAAFLLLFHIAGFTALGEYLCAVFPGDSGVPMHWLEPARVVVRLLSQRGVPLGTLAALSETPARDPVVRTRRRPRDADTTAMMGAQDDEDCEDSVLSSTMSADRDDADEASCDDACEPRDAALFVRNLVKRYPTADTDAVHGLDITARKATILGLLGHNGAGKTTTVGILTGVVNPTSYRECRVAGYDLRTEHAAVRRAIAVCPQFDVLFDDLDAPQHLAFYGALKEQAGSALRDRIAVLTDALGLEDDAPPGKKMCDCSTGTRRRVSTACALVGDAPIVFLDEPTAGLDPAARRIVWALLRAERDAGRTMVLTTHHMEEAEYLCDRIAIVAKGVVKCTGTAAQLKARHGPGYFLTVRTVDDGLCHDSAAHRLVGMCAEHVKHATTDAAAAPTLYRTTSTAVTVLIPAAAQAALPELLARVERDLSSLGGQSLELAASSLEDVFVHFAAKELNITPAGLAGSAPATAAATARSLPEALEFLPDGDRAFATLRAATAHRRTWIGSATQWCANAAIVAHKTARIWRRSPRLVFMASVVPILFIAAGFASMVPVLGTQRAFAAAFARAPVTQIGPALDDMDLAEPIPLLTVAQREWAHNRETVLPRPAVADVNELSRNVSRVLRGYLRRLGAAGIAAPLRNPSRLTFKSMTMGTYTSGRYADTHSLGFFATLPAPPAVQLIVGVITPAVVRYQWAVTTRGVPARRRSGLALLDLVLRAAVQGRSADSLPLLNFTTVALNFSNSPSTTPVPANDPNSYEPPQWGGYKEVYFTPPLILLTLVAVVQFAASTALHALDDVSKGTFASLRIHGVAAGAYWTGTVCCDLVASVPLVAAFIAGIYLHGVEQMQGTAKITWYVLGLFALVANTQLMALSLTTMLPPKTHHSTFVVLTFFSVIVVALMPFVVLGAVAMLEAVFRWRIFSWAGHDATLMQFTLHGSAPVAFGAIVLADGTIPIPDVSLSQLRVGCFFAIVAWCAVPVSVLVWHSHGSDMTAGAKRYWRNRRRHDALHNVMHEQLDTAAGADDSVVSERVRVHAAPDDVDVVQLHDATVRYAADHTDPPCLRGRSIACCARCCCCCAMPFFRGSTDAVSNCTLGVTRGQCIGLVGPNEAGKTTTIRALLADVPVATGNVSYPGAAAQFVCCPDAPWRTREAVYNAVALGVCAQHDTLVDDLTGREHLQLYLCARLGTAVVRTRWHAYIDAALALMHLDGSDLHKPVGQYSGGMKRRLAVAIALFTGAEAIALDEPSTGMDPLTRRSMWRGIAGVTHSAAAGADDDRSGSGSGAAATLGDPPRAVLLSTHSMDEAEAVCDRVAVLVGGELRHVAPLADTRRRLGLGYTVSVECRDVARLEAFDAALREAASCMGPGGAAAHCRVLETRGAVREYNLSDISVPDAVTWLQREATERGVAFFSVGRTASLDELFRAAEAGGALPGTAAVPVN